MMQYLPFADAKALAVYDAFERAVYQSLGAAPSEIDVPNTKTTPDDGGRPSLHLRAGHHGARCAALPHRTRLDRRRFGAVGACTRSQVTAGCGGQRGDGRAAAEDRRRNPGSLRALDADAQRAAAGERRRRTAAVSSSLHKHRCRSIRTARRSRPFSRPVKTSKAVSPTRPGPRSSGINASPYARATTRMPSACRWGFCSFISGPNHA